MAHDTLKAAQFVGHCVSLVISRRLLEPWELGGFLSNSVILGGWARSHQL